MCIQFPQLGVFGSSSISPEFGREPDCGVKPFLPFLALRDGKKAVWSNQRDFAAFPCGAGMVIRRSVGLEYYDRMKNTAAMDLGRKGTGMNAGDDTALVLAALANGLGTGVFPELRLTHVIPTSRLERPYLRQLATGISRSLTRLKFDLGMQPRSTAACLRMCISGVLQMLRHPHQWSFQWCILKGQIQAWLQRP